MKKKTKRIIIAAAAVVLVAAAVIIFSTVSVSAGNSANTYSTDIATTGDISKAVSGSGNLDSAKTLNVTADSHLDISEVLVYTGDTLKEDQPVASLNIEAMRDYSGDLKTQIDSVRTQIDTTNNTTTRLSIKSPVDGWVKNVLLDEDDSIEDAMNEYGYVALVATQERELISAKGSSLAEGTAVRVKCESKWHDGAVTNEKGALYVSIDTIARTVGADAQVYDADGNLLFTGKIELAAYQKIESSYGVITDAGFSEDEEIEAGETIYSAEQYSQDVMELYVSLSELKEEYDTLQALIEAGQLTSPVAGVVDTLSLAAGQTVDKGASLMTVDSTDDWVATVSVDELDINSIKTGQYVSVTLDSMPNDTFSGKVTRVSDLGSASNGITTYDVDVTVDSNENFKLGMTVSCEITSEEAKNAVLVPVDDVLTANNRSYVMVVLERTDAEKSTIKQLISDNDFKGMADFMGEDAAALNITMLPDPEQLLYSEVRAVETGIENAYYVEIKSGLSEGEKVIKQTSDSGDSESGFFMNGMGAMGGGQMGGPPSGGGGAMGGGQRPDGGFGRN